jgi:hypothetical protein
MIWKDTGGHVTGPLVPLTTLQNTSIADWIVITCLRFGASIPTAYRVAALFVEGIDREDDHART